MNVYTNVVKQILEKKQRFKQGDAVYRAEWM